MALAPTAYMHPATIAGRSALVLANVGDTNILFASEEHGIKKLFVPEEGEGDRVMNGLGHRNFGLALPDQEVDLEQSTATITDNPTPENIKIFYLDDPKLPETFALIPVSDGVLDDEHGNSLDNAALTEQYRAVVSELDPDYNYNTAASMSRWLEEYSVRNDDTTSVAHVYRRVPSPEPEPSAPEAQPSAPEFEPLPTAVGGQSKIRRLTDQERTDGSIVKGLISIYRDAIIAHGHSNPELARELRDVLDHIIHESNGGRVDSKRIDALDEDYAIHHDLGRRHGTRGVFDGAGGHELEKDPAGPRRASNAAGVEYAKMMAFAAQRYGNPPAVDTPEEAIKIHQDAMNSADEAALGSGLGVTTAATMQEFIIGGRRAVLPDLVGDGAIVQWTESGGFEQLYAEQAENGQLTAALGYDPFFYEERRPNAYQIIYLDQFDPDNRPLMFAMTDGATDDVNGGSSPYRLQFEEDLNNRYGDIVRNNRDNLDAVVEDMVLASVKNDDVKISAMSLVDSTPSTTENTTGNAGAEAGTSPEPEQTSTYAEGRTDLAPELLDRVYAAQVEVNTLLDTLESTPRGDSDGIRMIKQQIEDRLYLATADAPSLEGAERKIEEYRNFIASITSPAGDKK